MQLKHVLLCAFAVIAAGNCEKEIDSNQNRSSDSQTGALSERGLNLADFLPCLVQLDLGCVFDKTEDVLHGTTRMLLGKVLTN